MEKKKKEEPVDTGPNETEVHQTAVIASTFANMELHSTKTTLQQYVQLYNAAKEEGQRLATELAERDRDSMSVVHFQRRELEKQTEQLKTQQKQASEDMEKAKGEFNKERKELQGEIGKRDQQIDELKECISDLQADLDALSAFKRERNELRLELSKFQDQAKAEADASKAEISRLRFESIEEKVRLKAEEKALNAKFKKDVADHAMKQLASKTKEIYSENYMLVQDKVLLEKELERLNQANTDSEQHLTSLKRDFSLGKTNEDEFARRNAKLQRTNKQLNEKVAELEDNLSKVVERYEMKLAEQTKKSSLQIVSLQDDRDDAHRTAAARHKELVRMRQLTKQIVQQRSDLEAFFNEALEYVRSQIASERSDTLGMRSGKTTVPAIGMRRSIEKKNKKSSAQGADPKNEFLQGNFEALPTGEAPLHREVASAHNVKVPSTRDSIHSNTGRNSSSASSLPPIPSAQGSRSSTARQPFTGNNHPSGYPDGKKVDISQLSWADKERVLRILFSKINQVRADRHKAKQGANQTGYDEVAPSNGVASVGASSLTIQGVDSSVPMIEDRADSAGDDTFMTTPNE